MILLLDSNYRNKTIYPSISEYAIPINTTPSSRFNDNRCFYFLKQNILFSFQYIVQSEPLPYTLVSNTELLIEYPTTLPPNLYIVFQNYLSGFVVRELTTGYTGIIESSQFMPNGLYCVFQYSLLFPTSGQVRLVNPTQSSLSFPQVQFLIYGFSSFNYTPNTSYLKDYGITNECMIVNLTKNWKTYATPYLEPFKVVWITNSFPIEQDDYFVYLNPSPFNDQFESIVILSFFPQGVYRFEVTKTSFSVEIPNEIFESSIYHISIQYYEDDYRLVNPGNSLASLSDGPILMVSATDPSRSLSIRIIETSFSIQVQQIPPFIRNSFSKYLFFFLTSRTWIPFYSYVTDIEYETKLIFMDTPYSSVSTIGEIKDDPFCPYGGFLLFEPFLSNLNMPIANSTLSCYEVSLTHLALPNLPVCGYNQLLSLFPFLYVNFGNTTNAVEVYGSTTSIGSFISNDPNAVRANFVCPIANLKNPLIIQYVTIFSTQVVRMKLNFQEDIRIQVFLPDGRLLSYSDVYGFNYRTNAIMKSNQCVHLPLNRSLQFKVYTGIDNVYITAVFYIKSLV